MAKHDIFKDAFKSIDKLNEDSSLLSDNTLSVVRNYIDTGSMALNAIISGSLFGGVPEGRIIGFAGPQQSGKTLILNKIIANKQKADPDAWGVIWDSEAAYDVGTVANVGGDPNRIKLCPVESVESCRNQVGAFLDQIIATPALKGKVVISIDSIGNLASEKELDDMRKGKSASDMGTKAKALKSMMRGLTYKAAKANTTVLFANHIYDDPSSMYPSIVKSQSGGKGPLYLASVLVQLATSHQKDEKNIMAIAGSKVSGAILKAMTVKNRFIPSNLTTDLELNFKTGLYKYSGLLEMAYLYDVLQKEGNSYYLNGEKLGTESRFKNKVDLWDKHIVPALEIKLKENLKYNQVDQSNDLPETEEESEVEE